MEPGNQLTIYDVLGEEEGGQDEGSYPGWVEIPGVRDWGTLEPASPEEDQEESA